MKKTNTDHKAFLHLVAAIALSLLFLSLNVPETECLIMADALAAVGYNATRISDSLPDDEEFSMESETNRRILYAGKTIKNDPLQADKGFCNKQPTYFKCIKRPNKVDTGRQCNHATCLRPTSK